MDQNLPAKEKQPATSPAVRRAAQWLLYLSAAIWTVLSLVTWIRMSARFPEQPAAAALLAFLMLGNAAIFVWLGSALGKGRPWVYWLGALFLLVNIVLSVTDEFGFIDLLTMAIDLLVLGLMFFSWPRR